MLPTINISWPSLDLILIPYNRGPRLGVGTRWWFQISVSLGRQHDDIIKWKHFPRYWPFMRGIHWSLPSQRPVTRSFDVFFSLRLNKQLSKQSWGLWFETPKYPLWRHCAGAWPAVVTTITFTYTGNGYNHDLSKIWVKKPKVHFAGCSGKSEKKANPEWWCILFNFLFF